MFEISVAVLNGIKRNNINLCILLNTFFTCLLSIQLMLYIGPNSYCMDVSSRMVV
uniref:Uncharacterized protein n=1 Tax=Ciona intestinalis TaxID=7719 RepID=H2XVY5_CIOIN